MCYTVCALREGWHKLGCCWWTTQTRLRIMLCLLFFPSSIAAAGRTIRQQKCKQEHAHKGHNRQMWTDIKLEPMGQNGGWVENGVGGIRKHKNKKMTAACVWLLANGGGVDICGGEIACTLANSGHIMQNTQSTYSITHTSTRAHVIALLHAIIITDLHPISIVPLTYF